MKKYLPYIAAILVPVMTFVIFFAMARNRSFIFQGSFSSEVKAELNGVSSELSDKISKQIYSAMVLLSNKTEIKAAFFASNNEASSDVIRRVSNTINAYVLGSKFVSSIVVANNDREIIVSSGRTETGQRQVDEELWNKLKDTSVDELRHVFYNNKYVFSMPINNDGKLLLYVDVKRFNSVIPETKKWLSKRLMFSKNALFFACDSQGLKAELVAKIKKRSRNYNNPVEYKISGYMIWGKRQVLKLRDGRNVKTNIIAFVIGNPKDFPLNLLQKLLLIINGSLVVALLILMMLKLKNEKEKQRIREYKERTNFVFDMLEESSKVLDESARGSELTLNDLEEIAMDMGKNGAISTSEITFDEVKAAEVETEAVSEDIEAVEEEGIVTVPEEAYEHAHVSNIDEELKELAEKVSTGVDIENTSLKNYWSNIRGVLDIDFDVHKYALLEKDKDGLFSVANSSGFTEETIDNLKFTEFDKFYDKFFKLNKNLYIIKDAFANRELSKMFSPTDQQGIGELLIFPVSISGDVIALLCFAREKGLDKLREEELKDKIVDKSRLNDE